VQFTAAVALASTLLSTGPVAAQEPKSSTRTVAALTGRVERIDTFSRSLTLRRDDGQLQTISVSPEIELFRDLKAGETVTVRVVESVVVATRPGAKPTVIADTTAAANKESADSEVMQQLKAVVTVESADPRTQIIAYRTGDNRRVVRAAADPKLLEGLKPGDVIEITYTRERAIDLFRAR
jgi:hypothetical protein